MASRCARSCQGAWEWSTGWRRSEGPQQQPSTRPHRPRALHHPIWSVRHYSDVSMARPGLTRSHFSRLSHPVCHIPFGTPHVHFNFPIHHTPRFFRFASASTGAPPRTRAPKLMVMGRSLSCAVGTRACSTSRSRGVSSRRLKYHADFPHMSQHRFPAYHRFFFPAQGAIRARHAAP